MVPRMAVTTWETLGMAVFEEEICSRFGDTMVADTMEAFKKLRQGDSLADFFLHSPYSSLPSDSLSHTPSLSHPSFLLATVTRAVPGNT